MAYNDLLMEVIDQRVAAGVARDTATGTVSARSTTGTGAQVVFDGSALAVPVKVAGGVHAFAGDRVALQRFGADWVVVVSFTPRGPSRATTGGALGFGTTTSVTYVDMPGPVQLAFTKWYDLTTVVARIEVAAYTTGAGDTGVRYAVNMATGAGSTDYDVAHFFFNPGVQHLPVAGTAPITGLVAGVYTVTARWRRTAGTGTLTVDSNDWLSMDLNEVW
jgi:hypothetical protein